MKLLLAIALITVSGFAFAQDPSDIESRLSTQSGNVIQDTTWDIPSRNLDCNEEQAQNIFAKNRMLADAKIAMIVIERDTTCVLQEVRLGSAKAVCAQSATHDLIARMTFNYDCFGKGITSHATTKFSTLRRRP